MLVLPDYAMAVAACVVTMLCWGSWANTQKAAGKQWRFELFYWDYVIGVVALAVIAAFTAGSMGTAGRAFVPDAHQARFDLVISTFLGGVVFNLANILLVAAIAIAGMSVAFPVGIGLALIVGVLVNYYQAPAKSDPVLLFMGVGFVTVAIILDALAYRRLPGQGKGVSAKGIVLSLLCGILMGFFYLLVARALTSDAFKATDTTLGALEGGRLGPYTAVYFFSMGMLASNLVFNTAIMKRPFVGESVTMRDYFRGTIGQHLLGVLGGAIWCVGMLLSILAADQAGPAISYGLGQGATLVAAIWGVFVWREFREAPRGTGWFLAPMFLCFLIGIALVIVSREFTLSGLLGWK